MNEIIAVVLRLSLLPQFAVAATPEVGLEALFGAIDDQPGPFVIHLHCGDGKQTAELLIGRMSARSRQRWSRSVAAHMTDIDRNE